MVGQWETRQTFYEYAMALGIAGVTVIMLAPWLALQPCRLPRDGLAWIFHGVAVATNTAQTRMVSGRRPRACDLRRFKANYPAVALGNACRGVRRKLKGRESQYPAPLVIDWMRFSA